MEAVLSIARDARIGAKVINMMQRRGFASLWITECIKGFHCVVQIVLFLD